MIKFGPDFGGFLAPKMGQIWRKNGEKKGHLGVKNRSENIEVCQGQKVTFSGALGRSKMRFSLRTFSKNHT